MNMPENVILEHVSCCPLGCSKNDEVILTGRDLLHDLPGEFTVVKCRTCGLMRTTPRPTPETIGFYYPDDYGPYLGTQVNQAKPTSRIKELLRPLVKRVFNFNTQRLPSLAPGRMLEVGCASGAFLHQMASQGWQVQGIEFSEKAAQAAAQLGYRVHAGPLETAPPPEEPFDLIVGWMVLEHLHDPVGGLQKLREWARPGAWLALSVPNARSLEFRLFKEKWYALQVPTHLHHFTPETMGRVLQASGWTLKKVHHQRVLSNLFASTGYVLRDKGYAKLGKKLIEFPERGGRWSYALYPLAWLFSVFGQTGRMTVWARVSE
jgi:2-polyprenyl-3-methyl-5-hydroxy-6-metoxy-1,4-benzoquinol methylase